jgi:NAD(P)-dependent dehydrogenase (short-subunit alcohol dehydrogenase family)
MLQGLKNDVKGLGGSFYPLKADVSKEEEVVDAFAWVKKNLGSVDVLINNAGITGRSTLHGTATSHTQCRFLAFTAEGKKVLISILCFHLPSGPLCNVS